MISFYPGPSRVHDEIPRYVGEAFQAGVLSINHRSDEFMAMSSRTIGLLKEKLNVPADYTIFYTSSATECWEIIAQSIVRKKSLHVYNGAFGEKWFDYTKRIRPGAEAHPFPLESPPDPIALPIDADTELICITQNETSNGTQVANNAIRDVQANYPDVLLAIDATSSMAGIELDFSAADIWLASVQKCFGLPAGLGLMVCSPRALNVVQAVAEKDHYNSLTFMTSMMAKWQTPYTPNVLAIYLLMRVLEKRPSIQKIHRKTKRRYEQWMAFLSSMATVKHLVQNRAVHSHTVIPVTATPDLVATIKSTLKKDGLLVGEGYGALKETTFRIANFPAIKKAEIEILQRALKAFT